LTISGSALVVKTEERHLPGWGVPFRLRLFLSIEPHNIAANLHLGQSQLEAIRTGITDFGVKFIKHP